jgi:hypothetical protein
MGQCLKKHSQPRRDYDDNRIIRGKKPNSPLYNRDSQQHLIKKVTLPKMNDPRQILIKETNTAAQNKQTTLQSNKKLTTPVGLDSDSDDEMIIEGNAGHAGAMIDSVRKLNIDDNSSEGSDEGDDIEWVDDGRDEPMRLSASDVSMAHSTDMHQDHMVLSGKSMEDAGGKASLFAHPSSVPPHMKLSVSGAPMTQSQEARKKPALLNQPTYSPKILKTAIPPHLTKDFHRIKSNSTSTLFINSTLNSPDNEEIVRCMAVALYWSLRKNEKIANKKFADIFSERKFPLNDDIDLEHSPTIKQVQEFISVIFHGENLSAECGVMCMAYIERVLILTGVTIHASNWRRIVLGALILASKVWEDQAVWNVDFLNVFPNLTVDDLNQLERHYLNSLQFNVSLKASVYAKYYFELRALSERDSQHFPLKPLDKEGQKRLEIRSKGLETTAKKNKVQRSQSMDTYKSPSIPISLN